MGRSRNRDLARTLRRAMTPAERVLWARLRKRQIKGCLFRRQYPLGRFIVDFVCLGKRLVVEVDGRHHAAQDEADAQRTLWLEAQGFRVVRFWNTDVLGAIEPVLEAIAGAIEESVSPRTSFASPLPQASRRPRG